MLLSRTRIWIAVAVTTLSAGCTRDSVAPTAPTAPMQVVQAPIHHASLLNPGAVRTIYGPNPFTRSTGAPVTSTFTLAGFGTAATLTIVNGDAAGNHRVTSATVSVDGIETVHENQFGKKVATISAPIALRNSSVVAIRLASSPGDFITVSVDGTLATSGSVPTSGGVVHLLGEQVSLTVPPGAVSQPLTLTAEPVVAPSPEAAPGTIIELGPTGTTFTTPITLSIAFDPAHLPPGAKPASLHMYFWNVDRWEALPNSAVDMVHGIVTATTTHFTTFALLPGEVEFCQSDPTSEQSLQVAISHVSSGGRVFVCDGVNHAQMVTIDRPVTIQAEHPGLATIAQPDTASAGTYVLQLLNVPSGMVSLVDLVIDFRIRGFLAEGAYDQVVITGTTFRGLNPTLSNVGATFQQTSVATAHVTIDHDEFMGSSQGLLDGQPVDIDVTHSNFHDLGTFDLLLYSASASGSLPAAAGAVPPGFSPKSSTAHVEWNTFHNCGTSVCIAVEQASHGTVRFNTIVMDTGSVVDAILLRRGNQLPGLTSPMLVTDNTITGHGPAVGADSSLQGSWGVKFALRILSGTEVVSDSFARNTINTAFVALDMRAPMRPIVADNHISNVYGAVNLFNNIGNFDAVELHRNDISAYHYPIATNLTSLPLVAQAVAAIPGRLTCNYWGAASGPIAVFAGVPINSYTAFSAVPIAAQPSVSCDPSVVVFTTIRACPTPGGSVPTLPSILDAYNNVSTGGTVLICDGTFPVNQLLVNRSVTFAAEGPGMPTIDADGNPRAFNVNNVAGGPVTFSHLRFTGGTSSQVSVGANAGNVTLTQNVFHPGQTNPYGVQPFGGRSGIAVTGTGIGVVTVDHNAFIGGDIGVIPGAATGASYIITNNTFSTMLNAPISISPSTSLASSILIDHNTFDDCAANSCVVVGQPATISNNTFHAQIARRVFNFVQVQTGTSGSPAATMIVNNSMVAVDIGAGSRGTVTTYAVTEAVSVYTGTAQVSNNTITRTGHAVGAGVLGGLSATVTFTDNIVTTVATPFSGTGQLNGAAVITANWNDLRDYFSAFGTTVALNVSALNLRCNWWGAVTGPSNMQPGVPVGAYTPFATAPVAGNVHGGCDVVPQPPAAVVRVCGTAGNGVTVATLAEAYARVVAGGTVLICDGTHAVNDLSISKPVTITAEGPGMPTIDADGNPRAFNVNNVAGGPVTFSHLRFTGGTSSQVSIGTNAGNVTLAQNEFHPAQTNPYGVQPFGGRSGIAVNGTGIGVVTVDQNAFIGGDIGVSLDGAAGASYIITNNTFSTMVTAPISISPSTSLASSILIDHNTFDDCAASVCVFVGQPATISNNTFHAQIARRVSNFVQVHTGPSGSQAVTLISNNSMVAVDIGAGSRATTTTYAVTEAVSVYTGAAQVSNNTIVRTYKAVAAGILGGLSATVTFTDNIVTTVSNPFGGTGQLDGAAVITANWNDLSDYFSAFGTTVSLDIGALNLRCNWWGSAAGPYNMQPGVPVGAYTPFATAVVAGSHTGCSP